MIRGVLGKTPNENTYFGLFCRAVCFMKTLRKCNQSSDFQTIAHVNRALLELTTDMILLHHDKADGYLKMRAWEESAKLKAAEKVLRYYGEQGLALPDHYHAQKAFIDKDKEAIVHKRQQFWAKVNHPVCRWTGNRLNTDVEIADSHENTKLTEIYCTEYQKMNWMTHGSALAGLRHMEPSGFMNLCGLSYAACGKLALLCAQMALKKFGFWKEGIYRGRWEDINRRIERHMASFLPAD